MVSVFKPNLLLELGYGQLEEAIAYRSLAQMNRIFLRRRKVRHMISKDFLMGGSRLWSWRLVGQADYTVY